MMKKALHKVKMAPRADAPPGLETDGRGQMIPYAERTEEDKEKVATSIYHALHADNLGAKNPEQEAEAPGMMPKSGQGLTGAREHHDLEGQQGGTEGGGREQH